MKLRITVTQEDIDTARSHEGEMFKDDPVALAVMRQTDLKRAMVVGGRIVGDDYNYPIPEKAMVWERRWLRGKPVEPFSFLWKR